MKYSGGLFWEVFSLRNLSTLALKSERGFATNCRVRVRSQVLLNY